MGRIHGPTAFTAPMVRDCAHRPTPNLLNLQEGAFLDCSKATPLLSCEICDLSTHRDAHHLAVNWRGLWSVHFCMGQETGPSLLLKNVRHTFLYTPRNFFTMAYVRAHTFLTGLETGPSLLLKNTQKRFLLRGGTAKKIDRGGPKQAEFHQMHIADAAGLPLLYSRCMYIWSLAK